MTRLVPLAMLLFVAGTVSAQQTDEERRAVRLAKWERIYEIERRIANARPQRRDAPMRAQNILDEEVREIQVSASQVAPKAIVNISAVVTGCPCEDGASCTDQVWILAYRPDRTMGLLLSKIADHWVVGPVQRWFIDYEALLARGYTTDEEIAMKERFPVCAVSENSAERDSFVPG